MRASIPLPRRCERRTLPIELIPLRTPEMSYRTLPYQQLVDWLAEWSKALVLGTSLFGGVGSNPTPVIFFITLNTVITKIVLTSQNLFNLSIV